MNQIVIIKDTSINQDSLYIQSLKRAIESLNSTPLEITSNEGLVYNPEIKYCPLTLDLAETFPEKALFDACKAVEQQQQWVKETLDYSVGNGPYHLPIVYTAKGPLYGEAIELLAEKGKYHQPFDLKDDQRQPLYHLAFELLAYLEATPGVYMLQFGIVGKEIVFDRLFPFPTPSSIASLEVQEPDLLTCHWLCITQQPIVDLKIRSA